MNRIIYISSFMLFMAITVRAQLIFSNGKKVAVGTDTVVFEPSVVMGTWGIRCQAKTTRQSYWHELRDHQKYCKKMT